MANSYKTGLVSVTNGSAVVNGTGTAWAIENVVGGMFRLGTFEAEIIAATNTQLTLDTNYTGATASGQAYRIWLQDAQAASNITINRQLGAIIARLVDSAPEIQDFLDSATAGDALTALGVSGFIQTLLDDADQSTALATLGAASTGALAAYALLTGATFTGDVALSGRLRGTGTTFVAGTNAAGNMYFRPNGYLSSTNEFVVPSSGAPSIGGSTIHHDGNSARRPQSAAGNGQFGSIYAGPGASYSLPAGGTWAWFAVYTFASGGGIASNYTGVNAGGTAILAAAAGYAIAGFAWRISE